MADRRPGLPSRFVEAGGNRVFVRELGGRDAPPLVMLHGFRRCGLTFLPQMAPLSRHFRLIIPDLPGHGESPPGRTLLKISDMLVAIDAIYGQLRIREASLLGHSMGGVVAGRFALECPSRVRSLIFLESLPVVGVWIQPDKAKRSVAGTVGRRLDGYITAKNTLSYSEAMYSYLLKDLLEQNVTGVFTMPELRILLILNRCRRNPAAYYRRKITEELKRAGHRPVRNYELEMIDECGHFPHWTATKKVNTRITGFLKEGAP